MSDDLDLEQRYRRVLRLLPGYYRDRWEEDMVAAFLDSWLTGDPDEDSVTMEYDRPSRKEIISVAGLAVRLYLGGAGAPGRYFAWGQAVRGAVLTVLLFHALRGLNGIVLIFLPWSRDRIIPGPPATIVTTSPAGFWPPSVWYVAGFAWIVVFFALVLGYRRTAQVLAVLAIVPDLAFLLPWQLNGALMSPFGSWGYWFLLDLAPVLAMTAFHRDAPQVSQWPWLMALPAAYFLIAAPEVVAYLTGHGGWVPDTPGLCCILVAVLCLAHAPRARSSRAGTGVWSLTLVLLAALAGAYRAISLANYLPDPRLVNYLQDPHLIHVGLGELLILAAAAALVAPDAARTQTALPAPPLHPHLG